ncbi:hypothetical protein GCM10010282_18010 [Streptomyces roseolus]|nr:hypothetical protein GCM10010282_18010 [Streptomyces roseolus]
MPPPPKGSQAEYGAFRPVCQEWLAVVALIANTSTRPSAVRAVVSSASGIPPVPVHSDQEEGPVCHLWKTPSELEANTSSRPSWLWLTARSCPPPPKSSHPDQPPLTAVW